MGNRQLRAYSTRVTPQSEPIPGRDQKLNEAGGYVFEVDDWTRLDRFLVLGTEGGTYYVGERKLMLDECAAVLRCIQDDGQRVVNRVVEVSQGGRAPRNDEALFVLALCARKGNIVTRQQAYRALELVARTGTHLFQFNTFAEQFGGRGRGLNRAVRRWYLDSSLEKLVYQVVKYRSRDGWSHRDLLRLVRPKTDDPLRNAIFRWIVKRDWIASADYQVPALIMGLEAAQVAKTVDEWVRVVHLYKLTHEMLPKEALAHPEVWEALLHGMPYTATLRNLGNLSKHGVVKPFSHGEEIVLQRLADPEQIRRARVHPVALLVALMTYRSGHGLRGRGEWTPTSRVVDALDGAFYQAFENVAPMGKRVLLGLDWSGSMGSGGVAGVEGLTPAMGAAAMALVTAATEPKHHILAFATSYKPVVLSPRMRLDDALDAAWAATGEGTDCSVPVQYALREKLDVDAFLIYTDSQTWYGRVHPCQALQSYREQRQVPAKMVVVQMVAGQWSIGDSDDAGYLDVVGFDTAVPRLVRDFVAPEVAEVETA